jgi:NitT/TauT family transport system substrate-binding protein
MSKKLLSVAAIAVLMVTATLLTAGCLGDEDEEWDGTIRAAYLKGDIHQVAYFVANSADAGGGTSFFDQYDVKVENAKGAPYSNGAAVMTAFEAGDVDIGYLGSPPAIMGHVNGLIPTKVIGQVNSIGSALVVRDGINNASDLVGKTIGTPGTSTIQHFLLLKYLEDNGISASDVTITAPIPIGSMKIQLQEEVIDGFIAWQPFPADAVGDGIGHILADSTDIWPGHICCVLATMEDFAEDHPEAVTNYLRAHIAANKWIQNAMADNSSDEYQLLVNISMVFTDRSEAVVKDALDGMEYSYSLDATFLSSFEDFVDELIRQGTLEPEKMDKAGYDDAADLTDNYVDDSYIKDAEGSL